MYDVESKTLWVAFPDADGDTLLTGDDTGPYVRALQAGQWEGRPLTAVNFVFSDAEAARYNADSLAFLRVGVWLEGSPRRRWDGAAPDFTVRDEGII